MDEFEDKNIKGHREFNEYLLFVLKGIHLERIGNISQF